MSKREAIDILRPSLTAAIQEWMDNNSETEAWESLSAYIGDDTVYYMSCAAIAVLGGIADVQEWLRKEGDLK